MAKISYTDKVTGAGAPTGQFSAEDANETKRVVNENDLTLQSVTYDELQTLIGDSKLVVGKKYLINDFKTIYDMPDYDARDPWAAKTSIDTFESETVENIIVTAISNNKLSQIAESIDFPKDYIEYDVTKSTTYVNSSPAKGKITLRRDELGNEAEFDWRNVEYKRYNHGDSQGYNKFWDDGSGDFVLKKLFVYYDAPYRVTNTVFKGFIEKIYGAENYGLPFDLPNNVIDGSYGIDTNTFGLSYCNHLTDIKDIKVDDDFQCNLMYMNGSSYIQSTTIGKNFYNNTFQAQIYGNIIGVNCSNNIIFTLNDSQIGNNFSDNNLLNGSVYNCEFGDNCTGNTIQDGSFSENIVGNYVQNCSFTGDFTQSKLSHTNNLVVLGTCQCNTIEKCYDLTIGSGSNYNVIKYSNTITIGQNCTYNTIIDFVVVTFGNSCNANKLKAGSTVIFGESCGWNEIENSLFSTFGDGCTNNKIFECSNIQFGISCNNNVFVYSGSITFGNACRAIKLNRDSNNITLAEGTINNSLGNILTYTQLLSAKDQGILRIGESYLITDFESIYDRPDFDSRDSFSPKSVIDTVASGIIEPLIVTAIANNSISNIVKSTLNPNDHIEYDINYAFTYVNSSSAKGKITLRRDKFGNEAEFDWKYITFKRYAHVDGLGYTKFWDDGNGDFQLMYLFKDYDENAGSIHYNNKFLGWNVAFFGPNNNGMPFDLPNNVVDSTYSFNNHMEICYNNHFGDLDNNFVQGDYNENIYYADMQNCKIGPFSGHNTFDAEIRNCNIMNGFGYNIFKGAVTFNTIGSGFQSNLTNIFQRNNLENVIVSNTDFTGATHVAASYNCVIMKGSDNNNKLQYFDGTVMQYVSPTA